MANILGVDLKLDQEYIKASVEDIVKSGIVQALGDPERIVKTAVDQTINMKVDRDGKPCNYGSVSYLNWVANKLDFVHNYPLLNGMYVVRTVQDVVREAMTDIVKEQADTIKELVKKQLSSKQFLNDVSGQFVKSLLDNTASTWKTPITVRFEKPEDSDY